MGYEIYLYTVMTLAWELDKDTHDHFRKFLDLFIDKRKICKDIKEFARTAWPGGGPWRPAHYNSIRHGLPGRVRNCHGPDPPSVTWTLANQKLALPKSIDKFHRSKYYIAGIEGQEYCRYLSGIGLQLDIYNREERHAVRRRHGDCVRLPGWHFGVELPVDVVLRVWKEPQEVTGREFGELSDEYYSAKNNKGRIRGLMKLEDS